MFEHLHTVLCCWTKASFVAQVYIVMEYLGGGSLHHYLKKKPNRRLEDARARRIFVQVRRGCHLRALVKEASESTN